MTDARKPSEKARAGVEKLRRMLAGIHPTNRNDDAVRLTKLTEAEIVAIVEFFDGAQP